MPDDPRARIEGYAAGVRATLDTLERAGCLTTSHAKRFVERLRRQMLSTPSDIVPCPHRETLERMHAYLYPELHNPRSCRSQWNASTIEVVALIQ